ncbi:MAG: UDP-glucose--hexose-1-phosphate uridylyltransferase, partial [Cellulosilyticaceae bacterium]
SMTLPDRSNHRMIRLHINQKDWMLQYSPYLYYEEHCILLSTQHEPMCINAQTFAHLLGFVEAFPHYFLGSNADLPIVGGSILSHEHYQGGRYHFPINTAKEQFSFVLDAYPGITCQTLHWPLSTIRLSSTSTEDLARCSAAILEVWRDYSDASCDILSHSLETPHNTITPIAHFENGMYVMDLVLRNNRTSETYPLGIFHPHQDVHHIKKENIGLIEVMGLAILPGRLLEELEAVKTYLTDHTASLAPYHLDWANELRKIYTPDQDLDDFIQKALAAKFTRVLEDAGVFKLNTSGTVGFKRFTNYLAATLK